MFNNSLFDEEAKLRMAEREQEAEADRLQNQLGNSDHGTARWVFGCFTLIAMLILVLTLL